MSAVERALDCFKEGFSCSQAVLSAFGPQLGLDREMALKVSTAFGGGMARLGETCGAVTGALMVIGLRHGRTRSDDEETKEQAYRLVRQFRERFCARNGSILCRDLLGCDISSPEGRGAAEERGLFTSLCPRFVQDAAEILEQMLMT